MSFGLKARIKMLERKHHMKPTFANYDAAVTRHGYRLCHVLEDSGVAESMRFFQALDGRAAEKPVLSQVDMSLEAFARDQEIIDLYCQKRREQSDGRLLTCYGRSPDEMLAHFFGVASNL